MGRKEGRGAVLLVGESKNRLKGEFSRAYEVVVAGLAARNGRAPSFQLPSTPWEVEELHKYSTP